MQSASDALAEGFPLGRYGEDGDELFSDILPYLIRLMHELKTTDSQACCMRQRDLAMALHCHDVYTALCDAYCSLE